MIFSELIRYASDVTMYLSYTFPFYIQRLILIYPVGFLKILKFKMKMFQTKSFMASREKEVGDLS